MIASVKDIVATAFAFSAVAISWAAVAEWGWPGTDSVRLTALVALVLGVTACAIGGVDAYSAGPDRAWYQRFGSFLGGVAGVAALVAIAFGWKPALVTVALVIAVLWVVTTARHLVTRAPAAAAAAA